MDKQFNKQLAASNILRFLWLLSIYSASAQQGFLSINCGSDESFTVGGMFWEGDSPYVQGGKVGRIQGIIPSTPRYFETLRYFPPEREGSRYPTHCFRLLVNRKEKYLVRASFMYGNYDNKNSAPIFELGVGLAKVATVHTTLTGSQEYEVILKPKSSRLLVCLTQLHLDSVPFISSLELRQLRSSMYTTVTSKKAIIRSLRVNFGSTSAQLLRWPDDDYDRIWQPDTKFFGSNDRKWKSAITTELISSVGCSRNLNLPPQSVFQTAVALDSSVKTTLHFSIPYLVDTSQPYVAAYFSNIFDTSARNLSVQVENSFARWVEVQPLTSKELIINDLLVSRGAFGLNISDVSRNGPFINGLEVYASVDTIGTSDNDRKILKILQTSLSGLDSYFGDPCQPFPWDWIICKAEMSETNEINVFRVSAINLSSRRLSGLLPAAIANLNLEQLHLDNNELEGLIPDFRSAHNLHTLNLQNNFLNGTLPRGLALLNLSQLYVQYNRLSGTIPQQLANKQGLDLRIEGNEELCFSNGTCGFARIGRFPVSPTLKSEPLGTKTKSTGALVVVGGAIAAAVAFTLCLCVSVYCYVYRTRHERRWRYYSDPNLKGCPLISCSKKRSSTSHLDPVGMNLSRVATTGLQPNDPATLTPLYLATTEAQRETQIFRSVEIKKATQNYASQLEGGRFGPVYYGRLANFTEVAVEVRCQQSCLEIATEVEILSRAKHPNLVALIGYCLESKDYMLIYEYLSAGTLHAHIHGLHGEKSLPWKTRLKIAVDAAKGLEYLHNDCFPTVIHGNVTSSNIVLTANFDSKVADFGRSKFLQVLGPLCDDNNSCHQDPEFIESQRLTHKSDVYSFGIVLLELITGREPVNENLPRESKDLLDWTRRFLRRGELGKVVDPNLNGIYSAESMWTVAELAMTCVEPRSLHRPTMDEVVTELQSAVEIETDGQSVLVLPTAYHRRNLSLLDPTRQYHSPFHEPWQHF